MAGLSWSVWVSKDVVGVAGDSTEKTDLGEARYGDFQYDTFD
jgi:hypothetical protein